MIFLDTSAFAKLYVPERESTALRDLADAADEICASALVRVELMSVFHRRWREAKWSHPDFLAAVRQFTADDTGGIWTWLPLDRAIVEAASKIYASLPAKAFLRSSDCLHLATALHHNFTAIYTYDAHQIAAADILGIKACVVSS
jgi:predicted nucleic acid-binding protein